ncbi:hypothetical protein BBJ28_00005338 [Nothophytophthora sp. Chile5]|nr:hypothetical protein BBJ28_00005338 [Nothophytophthora sp. Chile5]
MDEPYEPAHAAKRERIAPPPPPSASASLQAAGEASRDLQITGVTRKDASWQYHIEVLDVRADPSQSSARTRGTVPTGGSSDEQEGVSDPESSFYPELPPMVRYTVMRRYTDFRQLYNYLVDTHGAALRDALPKFPDGGWLSYLRGDDPRLLHHRRERLQRFLRAVDARPELRWTAAFSSFLRPDLHELTSTLSSSDGRLASTCCSSASFAATSSSCSGTGELDAAQLPPPPKSAPASLPPSHGRPDGLDASGVPHVRASTGYVSLSQLKSPEIRFRKKLTPGSAAARGDLKRRRLHLHSQDADDVDADQRKPSAKKQLALALSGALGFKRFVVGVGSNVLGSLGRIGSERADSIVDEEDESESDTDDDDASNKTDQGGRGRSADLLKLLSSGGSRAVQP